ncbi:MAG: mannitol dehydrogenase family protein [Clostridia bacterium]|nr:mannitol dehydrogenase family protein [Clostridia bacterium]
MKLNLDGIKDRAAWEGAGISLPSYDVEKIKENTLAAPRWVHFGAGNIFRIFIGGIADKLISAGKCDTGIICAETFDFDVTDKIYKPYDNLVLAVTLKADGSTDKEVYGSLCGALKTEGNFDRNELKRIFTSESLQIVSFTITEKGYALKNASGEYFGFVEEDMKNGPENAKSAMAVVCAMLYERYKAGKYPIAVVSMDNCSHNGEKLKGSVVETARVWKANGFVDDGFLEYITDESVVSFPWTMIDKITPRPADSVAEELKRAGVDDMEPIVTSKKTYIAPFVNAEGPQYLVVEDNFPNGRPPLEEAGVYMTDRETVNKVERMKVTTCLNPLHTALAVYGCLLGYTLIADEMRDAELKGLVEKIAFDEGMPVVTDPVILSPEKFVDEVLNVRMPNPFMPDAPQRIATDTSQKVGIRYGETIKAYVKKYGTAEKLTYIPLAIAGWCRYLTGIDDNGEEFERSSDPMLGELDGLLGGLGIGDKCSDKLRPILSNVNIFGINLYDAGIGEKIEGFFDELNSGKGAVRAVLKKYVN